MNNITNQTQEKRSNERIKKQYTIIKDEKRLLSKKYNRLSNFSVFQLRYNRIRFFDNFSELYTFIGDIAMTLSC